MPPDTEVVREWLLLAAQDLRAARCLLSCKRPLLRPAGFHCQQAVEKAVKALLEYREIRPPKTHALAELFDFAETIDAEIADVRDAQWLTQFSVAARYPGYQTGGGLESACEGLAAAKRVLRFVLVRVPKEGRR